MRLILDAVDDGLADDRLPHNQFISRFNTFAGDAYRVCCTLVVEIVYRSDDLLVALVKGVEGVEELD